MNTTMDRAVFTLQQKHDVAVARVAELEARQVLYLSTIRDRDAALDRVAKMDAALREVIAMTDENTGTFRKRGGTLRGLVGKVACDALGVSVYPPHAALAKEQA